MFDLNLLATAFLNKALSTAMHIYVSFVEITERQCYQRKNMQNQTQFFQ